MIIIPQTCLNSYTGTNKDRRHSWVTSFWISNLDHSQILSQLSQEKLIHLYSQPQASLFDCTNKIGSIYTLRDNISNPPHQGAIKPLVWGIGYIVPQCTDTPNSISAIKQGGLGQTLKIYNCLIAQLDQDTKN